MKFALCTLCLVAVLAAVVADSDAGHFIPKAFYTLDSNGQKSNLHPVNPHTAHYLRRLRRQVQTSSSSSSSSVSTDGGPVFFSSQSINSHTPAAVSFDMRFGADSIGAALDHVGQPIGHVIQTTGVIKDGHVYYDTKEGHF